MRLAGAQTSSPRTSSAKGSGAGEIQAHDRGHGALPRRYCLLHGFAAQVNQSDRICERQGSRGHQCGKLAQRVAGAKVERQIDRFTHRPQDSDRIGQDGRLRILGEREPIGRTLETDFGDRKAERLIGLFEDRAGAGKLAGQIAAHADALRPLTWKQQSGFHGSIQTAESLHDLSR